MAADKKRLGATLSGVRARRGEFELRQRQLPADRHARSSFGKARTVAREELDKTPLGAPPANCDVRSVYDARPINAYDFNIVASAGESIIDTIIVEFTVREGYVAVVREIHHWFEPAPLATLRSDVELTLFLNGGALPDLIDIPVGVESDALVKCFIVADEFNVIRARLQTPGTFSISGSVGFVMFYGNYLLKSGVPANQQIANCVGTGRVVSSRMTPPPPPTPPTSTSHAIARAEIRRVPESASKGPLIARSFTSKPNR